MLIKQGCTFMKLKPNNNHHNGKHYHHHPSRCTKFEAKEEWHHFFETRKYCAPQTCSMRPKCEKEFIFGSTKIMQFAINHQKNGNLVHGKFIMTRHWHHQPNVCSNFQPDTTFHKSGNCCTHQTLSKVNFPSSSKLRTPWKVTHLKMW